MKSSTVLDSIKQTLATNMPVGGKAYLYGSRARGDHRPDSDWDVLILLNQDKLTPADRDNIETPLYDLGFDTDQLISPILYTVRDWEWRRSTPFYENVMLDRKPHV